MIKVCYHCVSCLLRNKNNQQSPSPDNAERARYPNHIRRSRLRYFDFCHFVVISLDILLLYFTFIT